MDQNSIDRFYKGESSPEEVKAVLQWFKSQELTKGQEKQLEELWAQAYAQQANQDLAHDADATWQKIEASINQNAVDIAQGTKVIPLHTGSAWTNWLRVAATLLLPLGLVWLVASQYFKKEKAAGKLVQVLAAAGERKTIQLEDGSTIFLRPGSKVTYPKPFASTRRDINLEGEAFFEVAKDKDRPFVVKSGGISTQALGTSFNIRFLPKDTAVSVALATGLVRITQDTKQGEATLEKLVPGQQLVYNRKNQRHAVARFDARQVLGWKDGILHFKKASLEEVLSTLETWYGVTIAVKGTQPVKSRNWSYTGEYVRQDLPQVLEGIGFVKEFTYAIHDKQVQIQFKRP